jgi:hypothetical protein
MSAAEDQARMGIMPDAEDAASSTFAHEPDEGEGWWWFGVLATIKATAEQTGGRYTHHYDSSARRTASAIDDALGE